MPTTRELQSLRSFRRAAAQVRDASIIAEGQEIRLHVRPGDPGYADIFLQLLGNEAFRSLAVAIRLAYQQGETAHFLTICGLVHRLAPNAEGKETAAAIRAQYQDALDDPSSRFSAGDPPRQKVFTAREVFETWLYGIVFHQDESRQSDVELLSAEGALFQWSVQSTALQLAGRILDLDDVVADLLGDPRLPRI